MSDKRGELKTSNDAITVGVIHVLIIDHDVVLRCHIIGDVMINNQTQQSIEQSQIDFLIKFLELRLQQNVAFAFSDVPNVGEIVDTWNRKMFA